MGAEGKIRMRDVNVRFGGTFRPFARHLDVTGHLQTLGRQIPTGEQSKTIQNLVRLGILKTSALDAGFSLASVQLKDLRRGITENRLRAGLVAAVRTLPTVEDETRGVRLTIDSKAITSKGEFVEFNPFARAISATTNALWGIRQVLDPVGIERDPFVVAGLKLGRPTIAGVALAFFSATLPAFASHAIASGISVSAAVTIVTSIISTPALLGIFGVAGVIAYTSAKSPAFRDTLSRSIFPIFATAATLGVRAFLASSGFGWIWQFGAHIATMGGLHAIRGTFNHFFIEKDRIRKFLQNDSVLRNNMVLRDVAHEALGQLLDINRGRKITIDDVIRDLDGKIVNQDLPAEHRDAAQKVKDRVVGNRARDIDAIIQDVNNLMVDAIQHIRDIKIPDQLMVGLARTSRIYNWLYLAVLTPLWGSGGFTTANALIFGTIYLSQLYYTLGAAWYSKLMESAEYAENVGIPKLPENPEDRPVICTVRYSNKGTLARSGAIPSYVQADILNRVIYGKNHYVVFNNDSNNHYWFEVAGTTKMAQHIEARMHYILRRVLPGVAGIEAMEEVDRAQLAFALAVKEFEAEPMRMVDHAINAVYPDGPADGAPMRFRDGHSLYQRRIKKLCIGDGGGELACFRAVHALIEDLNLPNQERILKERILKELEQLVVKENLLNLSSIHKEEAVDLVCQRLQERLGLDEATINQIRNQIRTQIENYLIDTLQITAVNAKIDAPEACAIAIGIVQRTRAGLGFDAIARTADRLILRREKEANDPATLKNWIASSPHAKEFRRGIKDAFGLEAATADAIMEKLATAPIEESARIINEEVVAPPCIFYRAWRYAQMAFAWERTGVKSEEGNMRFLWQHLRNIPDPAPKAKPTPHQEMKQFIKDCAAMASKSPDEFINEIEKVGDVNVSAAMQIARAIQDQMINRGWLHKYSRKQTEDISRHVAFEIARRAAAIQPTSGDYEREATSRSISIATADAEVWERFTKQIPVIAEAVVRDISGRGKDMVEIPEGRITEIIEMTADAAQEEFTNNKNEIFRAATGFVEIAARDLNGVREVGNRFSANAALQTNIGTRLFRSFQNRNTARSMLTAMNPASIATVENIIPALIDSGLGNPCGKKGYYATFVELLRDIPQAIEKAKPVTMKASPFYLTTRTNRTPYEITAITDAGLAKQAKTLKTELANLKIPNIEEALRILVQAQIEENIAMAEIELWVSSQTRRYREGYGYERVVQEGSSVPIAAEIITQAKTVISSITGPLTVTTAVAAVARVSLAGREAAVVDSLIDLNTKEYGIKPNTPQRQALSVERRSLLDAMFTELTAGNIALNANGTTTQTIEQDAVTLRGTFDSVYRFSRVWGFRWLRGKDVNTNREFLGSRVYEQIGTLSRYLIGLHFEERRGFYYGSTILTQRLKVEVTQMLQISTNETQNQARHLELGIMPQDLLRRLLSGIASGLSHEAVAQREWDEIYKALTPEERAVVGAWNRTGEAKVMDQIRKNLIDIAQDVAVEFHAAEALRLLHAPLATPGAGPDKTNAVAYAHGISSGSVRRKVTAMVGHELNRLDRNAELVTDYESARRSNNVTRALEIEQEITYKGDVGTWAAQYRHGDPHPELIVGNRHRSFSEIAAWISSSQHAAERSVEKGELVEDCIMLRKIGAIADETIRAIETGNRRAVLDALPDDLRAQATPLVNTLIADTDMTYSGAGPRLFNSFDEAEGLRLKERKDRFEKLLGIILEAKERIAKPKAEAEEAQALKEGREPDRTNSIINCLDEARYPKTSMEQVRAKIQMNADTDNYFYPEILDAAGIFGNLWGILSNPNEVLQYGLNYSVPSRSPFVRFQRDRDLGGPQNSNVIRAVGATYGVVRHRWDRREFASTLTGYANLFPLGVAFRTTEYVIEPNVANSSFHGQRAWEKIFGPKWWEIDGPVTKWKDLTAFWSPIKRLANYNKIRADAPTRTEAVRKCAALFVNNFGRAVGYENGWEFFMMLSHWPPLIAIISGSALLMREALCPIVGYMTGTGMPSEVTESLEISLEKVLAGAAGIYAISKLLSHTLGRTLVMNNLYRGRRVYVLHPSEDLATTYTLMAKGIYLTSLKGLRQQNDAMVDYDGDMGQKLRWQASNAALLPMALRYIWKYRKVLTVKQSYDLIQGPLYNVFGLPGTFNRLAILGFAFLGEPSMLMLNPKAFYPLQDSLGWLLETGFVNYGLVEAVGIYSRISGGSSLKGMHSNLAYETNMIRFNYNFVMRRLWHGENASFNVTDPPEQVPQVKSFWEAKTLWGKDRMNLAMRFLSRNWFYITAQSYAVARIILTYGRDSIEKRDFNGMAMLSLVFWIGYPTYMMVKGLRMNHGISPIVDERKWEERHRVWQQRI